MNNLGATNIVKSTEQCDTKAQLALGDKYRDGFKVKQSYEQAFYWYKKAAEKKEITSLEMLKISGAFLDLGLLYLEHNICQNNIKKAIECFDEINKEHLLCSSTRIHELCLKFPRKNDSLDIDMLKYTLKELMLRIKEEINT